MCQMSLKLSVILGSNEAVQNYQGCVKKTREPDWYAPNGQRQGN